MRRIFNLFKKNPDQTGNDKKVDTNLTTSITSTKDTELIFKKFQKSASTLLSVPNEILATILQFIPIKDLLTNVPQACKELHYVISTKKDMLFKHFILYKQENRLTIKPQMANTNKGHSNYICLIGNGKSDFLKILNNDATNKSGGMFDITLNNLKYVIVDTPDLNNRLTYSNAALSFAQTVLLFPQGIDDIVSLYEKAKELTDIKKNTVKYTNNIA